MIQGKIFGLPAKKILQTVHAQSRLNLREVAVSTRGDTNVCPRSHANDSSKIRACS